MPIYYIKEAGEYHYQQFKKVLANNGFDVDRTDSDNLLRYFSSFLEICIDDEVKAFKESRREAEKALNDEYEMGEDKHEQTLYEKKRENAQMVAEISLEA